MSYVAVAIDLFPAAYTSIVAIVEATGPEPLGKFYHDSDVRVIGDGEVYTAFGFDKWFASQPDDVREYQHPFRHGSLAPAYYWSSVFVQLWCKRWNVSWYADESPGPFASSGILKAEEEGNKYVVLEGLS
jgi:hypothetical protein